MEGPVVPISRRSVPAPETSTAFGKTSTNARIIARELAPGTWYINVLAVQPQFCRLGLGTRLLALADKTAEVSGKRGISVIVSNANSGARRLYEHCGYNESATRLMVKENWENEGQSWVLLTKDL